MVSFRYRPVLLCTLPCRPPFECLRPPRGLTSLWTSTLPALLGPAMVAGQPWLPARLCPFGPIVCRPFCRPERWPCLSCRPLCWCRPLLAGVGCLPALREVPASCSSPGWFSISLCLGIGLAGQGGCRPCGRLHIIINRIVFQFLNYSIVLPASGRHTCWP